LRYKFSTECAGENFLKIYQYLANIWTKVCGLLFAPRLQYLNRQRVTLTFDLAFRSAIRWAKP